MSDLAYVQTKIQFPEINFILICKYFFMVTLKYNFDKSASSLLLYFFTEFIEKIYEVSIKFMELYSGYMDLCDTYID